jgi:hypothetical protein
MIIFIGPGERVWDEDVEKRRGPRPASHHNGTGTSLRLFWPGCFLRVWFCLFVDCCDHYRY